MYRYTPLPPNHIRLLYFVRGPGLGSSIVCSLKTILFGANHGPENEPIEYDALSYSWGSLSEVYPVRCDGQIMHVHRNLHEALPYLASRSSLLPIWIDALCIDQSNATEKIEQIKTMADIYRRASCVWSWLGVAQEPAASQAIELILPRIAEAYAQLYTLTGYATMQTRALGLPDVDSPAWDALEQMMSSPYFLRLWIVQEVCVARRLTFLFGRHEIEPALVLAVAKGAFSLPSLRSAGGKKLKQKDLIDSQRSYLFHCRMLYQDLLQQIRPNRDEVAGVIGLIFLGTIYHKCSEPKDNVLALVGLMGKDCSRQIVYDANTPASNLYIQFTRFLLLVANDTRYNWQNIFNLAVSSKGTASDLPSWCPDLHNCGSVGMYDLMLGREDTPFKASSKRQQVGSGQRVRDLVVRGTIFDIVEAVGARHEKVPLDDSDPVRDYRDFYYWEERAMELAEPLFHQKRKETSAQCAEFSPLDYWLTLLGEQTKLKDDSHTSHEDFMEAKMEARRAVAFHNNYVNETDLPAEAIAEHARLKRDADRIFLAIIPIRIVQADTRLFRTSGGRFGYATGDFERGDKLAVFDGATTPHLIRFHPTSAPNSHKLTGMAFVRGMMRGEIESLDLVSQEIVLV